MKIIGVVRYGGERQLIVFIFGVKPQIYEGVEWFANQIRVCMDGTANLRCAICK